MLTPFEIMMRLLLAALLGSIVGLERQKLYKAAGLRTHMLVCVGAALIMIVSAYGFNEVLGREATVLDPSRVAAQVVSGIGFLGAGIIIFRRDVVTGLTTAAGIWAIAAVGLAVGGGLYLASICTTLIILFVVVLLRPLEAKLRRGRRHLSVSVLADRSTPMSAIENAVRTENTTVSRIYLEKAEQSAHYNISIMLDSAAADRSFAVIEQIKNIPGVLRVEIEE